MNVDLAQISELTAQIIRNDGIENYLPTLIIPKEMCVRVLENAPKGSYQKVDAHDWVRQIDIEEGKEYFLAFKINESSVTIEWHKID